MNYQRILAILFSFLILFGISFGFTETKAPVKKVVPTVTAEPKNIPEKQEGAKPASNKTEKQVIQKADPAILQLLKNSPTSKEFPRSNAIVLLDESTIKFNEDGSSINTEHRMVKILNRQGLQRFSELRIPFSNATQKVRLEEIKVVRADGRLMPISKDSIRELSPPASGGAQAFSHLRVLIVQFPGLDLNGLMEYKITIEDKSGLRPLLGYEIYVQETEPIIDGKVVVSVPKSKTLHYQDVNLGKLIPEIKEESENRSYIWAYKNMSPFFMEPSMPAAKDFVGRLVLGLYDSWEKAFVDVDKIFTTKIPNEKELESTIKEVTKDAKDAEEKFRKVYSFVAGTVQTLPMELGKVGYTPQGTATLLKDKMGDAKDKAALLIAMLKGLGIEARPVLVSTNSNGRLIKDVVAASQFNHMLVWVPSKQLWLDPSSETAQIGYLPQESQGAEGVVLTEKGGTFAVLPVLNSQVNKEEITSKGKLLPDSTLETELALVERGANNLFIRYFLRGVKPQDRIMALESLAGQVTPRFQITSSYFSPVDDFNSPMEMKVAFQGKNYAMPAGDLLIFALPIVTTSRLEEQVKSMPAERKYPFVIGTSIHEEKTMGLELPQGYRLRVVPKGDEIANNIGSYKAVFSSENGKLVFKSSFVVNKPLVSVEELSGLRRLIDARSQMEREKIVLEKIR